MPEKIKVPSVVWHLDTGVRDLRGSEPAMPKPTDKAANPTIGAGPIVFDNLPAATPWSARGAPGIREFGASQNLCYS